MKFCKIVSVATALVLSTSANSALVSRLGGLAYYDTEADLTWLADANAGAGSEFESIFPINPGEMTWQNANAWAASLDVAGVTGWRLPKTIDVGNDGATYTNIFQGVDFGFNITTHSELSNLFFNVLGNLSYYDIDGNAAQDGWGLTNTGPFINIQDTYWSATEYAPFSATNAWYFSPFLGEQSQNGKTKSNIYAWAVHDGDIGAVPIPAAVWLFGSGLLGLIGVARRKA